MNEKKYLTVDYLEEAHMPNEMLEWFSTTYGGEVPLSELWASCPNPEWKVKLAFLFVSNDDLLKLTDKALNQMYNFTIKTIPEMSKYESLTRGNYGNFLMDALNVAYDKSLEGVDVWGFPICREYFTTALHWIDNSYDGLIVGYTDSEGSLTDRSVGIPTDAIPLVWSKVSCVKYALDYVRRYGVSSGLTTNADVVVEQAEWCGELLEL